MIGIWDLESELVRVLVSVHLGAHDLDPIDSQDRRGDHPPSISLFALHIQWAGFFRKRKHLLSLLAYALYYSAYEQIHLRLYFSYALIVY